MMASVKNSGRHILLTSAQQRLLCGRHHDPFAVLGRQRDAQGDLVRVYLPGAATVRLLGNDAEFDMQRIGDTDLFHWREIPNKVPRYFRLRWSDRDGGEIIEWYPYCFAPQISDFDLHLFGEGRHWHCYRFLGANPHLVEGIEGVLFATWAPNAEQISVVGDFNAWDARRHPLRARGNSGVWELFIPHLNPGTFYKFNIRDRHGERREKTDPYGRHFELRPHTASIITAATHYRWGDQSWMSQRATRDWQQQPLSIYEVHPGSWRRNAGGGFLNYRELAVQLVEYVQRLGFTHIELMPISEHPLDDSWGYQTTGYYAPSSRFGTPDDFRYFVDYCHQHRIGVLLDWVPAHFPRDEHALARFDGTALYEHEDPQRGEHKDWGTLIYNYGRNEVRNFLLANANFWLEEFHLDGLRVDAVASMLYLDYSRQPGEWTPNSHGGNENLEAIAFLRELNTLAHGRHPGVLVIAEESTAWPQVTRPTWVGGLGFSMKWNMGWMHDTLNYLAEDPVFRHYHHDQLTFGILYAFSENFVLPFSHDEVVHGKRALLDKMPGDDWRRYANLRLLYTYQFTYPGAKLLFMGDEFGQLREWSHQRALDWELLEQAAHGGLLWLVKDLNHLHRRQASLHRLNFSGAGFEWIDCHDAPQSIISYLRKDGLGGCVLVVLNFTPVPRIDYRIGVPCAGRWRELFNSDSRFYGGTDVGNAAERYTEPAPWMGREQSLVITLPPLAGIILKPGQD